MRVIEMNASLGFSIAMGVGWLVVVCMGVASLALGSTIARDYVFTAPGIARIGPRVGQHLASASFMHEGTRLSLRQVTSPDHATLLVFLGTVGSDVDKPHVRDMLLPDLLRFATLLADDLRITVFCTDQCEEMADILGANDHIKVFVVIGDQLETRLAVRVAPYAVLLDRQTKVLAKGLANHFGHLCLIVARGGQSGKGDLAHISRICQPFAPPLLVRGGQSGKRMLPELLRGDRNLIVFGSPTCPGCRRLLEDQAVARFLAGRGMPGYFLSDAAENSTTEPLSMPASLEMLLVDRRAFDDYDVTATPFAFVLTQTGAIIAQGTVPGIRPLRKLCDQADRQVHSSVQTSVQASSIQGAGR